MSRQALKAINWTALAERVPESQKNMLATLKSKTEQYLRKVHDYPETAPKIDWAHYKNIISVPGMVDSFQKQYEAMKIPFPVDNYTKIIVDADKEMDAQVAEFRAKMDKEIEKYKAKIDKINKSLPIEQMTMEEYMEAYPDFKIGSVSRPSIWPHTEEYQPEYIEKEMAENKGKSDH